MAGTEKTEEKYDFFNFLAFGYKLKKKKKESGGTANPEILKKSDKKA